MKKQKLDPDLGSGSEFNEYGSETLIKSRIKEV
jgi:hypothetical protein